MWDYVNMNPNAKTMSRDLGHVPASRDTRHMI